MEEGKLKNLNQYLEQFVTQERLDRINFVVNNRTRYLTLAMEDIFMPQNASAVVRSADCFGIQDLHIIQNRNPFRIDRGVAKGAEKWLTINYYNKKDIDNTKLCYDALKDKGYYIVATSPHPKGYIIEELPLDKKIALVLGNEREGLTKNAFEYADTFVRIPTFGFTESLNISVTAALGTYDLMNRIKKVGIDWQLSDDEKDELIFEMLQLSIPGASIIIERYLNGQ